MVTFAGANRDFAAHRTPDITLAWLIEQNPLWATWSNRKRLIQCSDFPLTQDGSRDIMSHLAELAPEFIFCTSNRTVLESLETDLFGVGTRQNLTENKTRKSGDVSRCYLLCLVAPGPRGTYDVCTVSLEKWLVSRLQCQRKKPEE